MSVRSCADIFARRGNPWVSERDADKDYPGRRTTYPEAQRQDFSSSVRQDRLKKNNDAIREKLGLSTADFKKPRIVSHYVDPDLDAFLLAEKAGEKRETKSRDFVSSRKSIRRFGVTIIR